MTCTLIQGDCIEEMQNLIKKNIKVDLILTDPPYGTTQCKWDTIIPFKPMLECIGSFTIPNTPILLFGTEPFSSHLRLSNLSNYKYDWIWNKTFGSNYFNANKMPLQSNELISVFYENLPIYNPQKKYVGVRRGNRKGGNIPNNNIYGNQKMHPPYVDDGYRYPLNVITCNPRQTEVNNNIRVHPTQKPVPLLEYLIRTYTNPNDTVLDFTMGSGSTGVACQNLNRDFIGIELDENYYSIAKERINTAQTKLM